MPSLQLISQLFWDCNDCWYYMVQFFLQFVSQLGKRNIASCSLGQPLAMASKQSRQSLHDILALNVEPNDVRSYMFELTNATMMDLTQTSTKIPQMINLIPRPITETK